MGSMLENSLLQKTDYLIPFLSEVSSIVGKRWSFRIIWELRHCNKIRYNELLERLGVISPSTLSDTLKFLYNQGLITRSVSGKNPPLRVEYEITKKGIDLLIASSNLVKWAIQKEI